MTRRAISRAAISHPAIFKVLTSLAVLLTWAVLAVVAVVIATFVLSHLHATCGIAATGPNC